MSSILGLHVGVSFAELSLLAAGTYETLAYQRVYLPRSPLKTALQKFLQKHPEHKIEKLFFMSNHLEKLAPFRLGGTTAHLVTEGWENIGWLSQVPEVPMPAARLPAVQSQELVFGVHERIGADGQVIHSMQLDHLQSIAAKLKMMEVKRVCIHFLHSQKNPIHAEQAHKFFREQNLEVYTSHYDSDFNLEKSRRLSLSAALKGTWEDFHKDLSEVFLATGSHCDIQVLGFDGFKPFSIDSDPLESLSSLDYLWKFLPHEHIVYLGFETFFQVHSQSFEKFWVSPWGRIYRPHSKKRIFNSQPTAHVQLNFWNELDFDTPEGFEPGPVCLGRGQKITAFDLYFEELMAQEEIRDWLAPTASSKIHSHLVTLSKNSRNHIGAAALMTQLREQFFQRLLFEIDSVDAQPVYFGFWTKILNRHIRGPIITQPISEVAIRVGLGLPV